MDYNTVENIEYCGEIVREFLPVLYYSHFPTAIIAFLVGLFVIYRSKSLLSKILFFISIFFATWSMIDLAIWYFYYKNTLIMFLWSSIGLLTGLIFVLSVYFFYVFIDKKDISFLKKVIMAILLLPIILLMPTTLNLSGFDIQECISIENSNFVNYYHLIGLIAFLWILVVAVYRYIKSSDRDYKKQILLMSIGLEFFIFSFLLTSYISSLIDNFKLEIFGLLAMGVFLAFLGYLIVKFKAFDIKLLGAQALVVAQFALIAAMFAFANNTTNLILIGVTLLGTAVMGVYLIRSVKAEVQRKEELQLMSDKLAGANDQLRKLDNSKSEFISIASHQLRTPITAIKGFVSLLLEGSYGKITPKQEDALNKAYSSNERLLILVEDLLNVSRIESGRMEFKLVPTNIVNICQEVADTLSMKARERKLYLNWEAPGEAMPELVIDGTKVREVISNMVDNALKYTEKGGVTVRVKRGQFPVTGSLQHTNELRDAVRVIVSDTGIGVPKEELPYLFSKFSRGKDVARLNSGGTGLGLYVGKAMIEQNGGKIWAESDGEGMGSRFIVELPVAQDEELMKRWGNNS